MPQRTCPALVEIYTQAEEACTFHCQRDRHHEPPHQIRQMGTAFGEDAPKAVRVQIEWED